MKMILQIIGGIILIMVIVGAVFTMQDMLYYKNNDKDNTGKIDFEKFKTVIFDMYSRENQKLPNFALVKNAYDTLDLRKDGIIDIKEWCIAFASYNSKLDSDADKIPNGPEFFTSFLFL